jgi:hypothetical protein
VAAPAEAREIWNRGEASLELSGSIRELLVLTSGTDADRFLEEAASDPQHCLLAATFAECRGFDVVGDWFTPTSLTRLRTRLEGSYGSHWSAVVVYDHELRAGRLNTFGADIGEDLRRSSFLGAEDEIIDGDHANWSHLLYRGYLHFDSKRVEATLGRQRIPWGVGRLWNPIDRFNAVPPLTLQPDQSAGVDAVDLRWLFDGFTYLEAVYAPERDGDDSSYALRLHGVLRDVDYSLVAGVFEEARTFGFDLAGNLAEAAARLEVVYTDPERKVWPIDDPRPSELDSFWQIVVSIDHLLDFGTGVYVLVEYLFNENDLGFGHGRAGPLLPLFEASMDPPPGLPADLEGTFANVTSDDRFGGSRVITRARHLTGVQLGYDVTPEVRADLVSIVDWSGWSATFYPALRYAPLDWLEVTLGAQLFVGPRRSEYGDLDPLGFLLLEAFF